MLERIKQLLKKISYLNAKINPTVLASSFAFYLLLTIIPLVILILNFLILIFGPAPQAGSPLHRGYFPSVTMTPFSLF